nr:receptor-like protein EIX1 [Ziziphus jujuba var. spinosa]
MLSSWVSQENCSKWAGNCLQFFNLTGHVEELHLDNSSLQGKINPVLNHLNYLDLSNNDFGGIRIPSFIGSLESLTYLNLTNAGFKGIIPHQIGNLSSLRCLGLQGQYDSLDQSELYVGNLHWLSGLSSVQQLDMSNVNLSKASDHWLQVINMLSSLPELHLSSCELAHIPSIFHVNFTSLSILDISSSNFHSALPNWLFTFKSLVYLDLQGSGFQGPIPCAIQNLTALRYLDLLESNFESTKIPSCLYDMPRLEYLNISSNNLEGVIASAIQNLISIVELDMSYNALEGIVPKSVGNLCNLEFINLRGNKFGGKLSNAFDSLLSGCLSNSLMSSDKS